MSIIYNALKKTQENLQAQQNIPPSKFKTRLPWIDILIVLFIVFLLIKAGGFYYPKMKSLLSSSTINANQTKNTVPPKENQVKLILNGVFISEQEKVALINNQPMHIGDTVQGLKVIAIEPDKVKLKSDTDIIVLPVNLNYANIPRVNKMMV